LFRRLRHFCAQWNGRSSRHVVGTINPTQESVHGPRTLKGAADKAKGAIKDAAGKVTGDKELQTEGKLDKAKSDAHNLGGDLKDAKNRKTGA
jgi:uncharacterized protein YjbJ (UPF0337 family)